MNEDPVIEVLRSATQFGGGVFSTQLTTGQAFMHMLSIPRGAKQGSSVTTWSDECSYGITQGINQGLLKVIGTERPVFDPFSTFQQSDTTFCLVTMAGYRKILQPKNYQQFASGALISALQLIECVDNYFGLLIGAGWTQIQGKEFPQDQIGEALAFAVFCGWLDSGPNCTFVLTPAGIKQKESPGIILGLLNLAGRLAELAPGREAAGEYHKLCMEVLTNVFGDSLSNPVKEQEIDEGQKRIDIKYTNSANKGFFFNMTKHVKCPYIFVECKNYSSDIKNEAFDQLTGRFGDSRGRFGLLVCRSINDEEAMLKRCKVIIREGNGYVLVLTDDDLKTITGEWILGNKNAVDEYLQAKLDALIF